MPPKVEIYFKFIFLFISYILKLFWICSCFSFFTSSKKKSLEKLCEQNEEGEEGEYLWIMMLSNDFFLKKNNKEQKGRGR